MRHDIFTLPWGRVYTVSTKTAFYDPQFRGNPEKYAKALHEEYNTWGGVLGFLDSLKLTAPDVFFTQVRNYVLNRIAGKSRKTRGQVAQADA
jgi:hypothetical protein